MNVTQAVQIAVARADLALCGAWRVISRAAIPALIVAVLLYATIKRRR